jgi:ParB/RepB/Spo0J family partition protein
MPEPQESLFPETRPRGTQRLVSLEAITRTDDVPPPGLLRSIEMLGILQPVILIGSAPYRIADGRRRVNAAAEVGLDGVPAITFPAGTSPTVAAAMALSTNVQRQQNLAGELASILELVRAGHDLAAISRELRIPMATVRQRMRLQGLLPELLRALSNGELPPSLAMRVVALPISRQRELVDVLEREGRIRSSDVDVLRTVEREAAVATLPDSLFGASVAPDIGRIRTSTGFIEIGQFVALLNASRTIDPQNDWFLCVTKLGEAMEAVPAAPDNETDTFWREIANVFVMITQHVQRTGG